MSTFTITAGALQGANKGQLREFMRQAQLPYNGLSVAAMTDALQPYVAADNGETAPPTMGEADAALAAPIEPVEPVAPPPPAAVVAPPANLFAEYGPAVELTNAPASKPGRASLPKSNGIAEPKVGTVCRMIWDHVRGQHAASGKTEAKALRAHGASQSPPWDPTTCNVQFYRCRKYHGWNQ